MRIETIARPLLCAAMFFLLFAAPPSRCLAVSIYTAPSGDLDGSGDVNVADLQCEVLIFQASVQEVTCVADSDCNGLGLSFGCRAGFSQDICLPYCLSQAVTLGESAQVSCTNPDADTAVCLGLVQRRNADMNCDGSINNVDFLFLVQILLEKLGGPNTADVDSDGRLNFCDDDSDGDGDPDATDCEVLDPAVNTLFQETCDDADNNCDGLIDSQDPQLVLEECAKQDGVCAGSQKPAQLCAAGQWASCTSQHYLAHAASYETAETLCDGVDNDCNGLADSADPQLPVPDCEVQVGVCLNSVKTSSLCQPGGWAVCDAVAYLANHVAYEPTELLCDGLDNDCNNQVDEPFPGLGAACDGPDSDQCEYGVLVCSTDGLTAVCGSETLQDLPEICQNQLDDDCDGQIDEHSAQDPCEPYRPPVASAALFFSATQGTAVGTTEPGPGQYESAVWNHTDIAASTAVHATAYGNDSGSKSSTAKASVPAEIQLWTGRDEGWADDPNIPLLVFLSDSNGLPVSGISPVTVNVDGPAGAAMVSLGGGSGGMYTGVYNPDPLSFVLGGTMSFVATAGGLTSGSALADAMQSPAPASLALSPGQTGLQLPLGHRLPGVQFTVPLTAHTGAQTLASVQVELAYPAGVVDYVGLSTSNSGLNPFTVAHDAGQGTLNIATTRNVQTDPALLAGDIALANITFRIKTGAAEGQSGSLSGQVLELLDTSGNNISTQPGAEIHDGSGQSLSGTITADGLETRALVAYSDDLILADLSGAGLAKDAGDLHVYRFRNNASTPQSFSGYSCSCAPACQCSGTSVVPAGNGVSTLEISHDGFSRQMTVNSWTVTDVQLLPHDLLLNLVDGWIGGYQATRYTVEATVTGPAAATQLLDITHSVDIQSSNGAVAQWDADAFQVHGLSSGTTVLSAKSAGGQTLATQSLNVSNDPVAVVGVTPIIPTLLEMLSIQPNPTPAFPGTTAARARLSSLFLEEGQGQPWHIILDTDDGSSFEGTGAPGLVVTTQSGGSIASIEGDSVVARGSGSDIVQVDWAPAGPVLVTGLADVEIVLPDPTSANFSPASSSLAIDGANAAAVVKGLPTSRNLSVTIQYDNGSTKNMTSDTRTLFEVTAGAQLVKVCNHDDQAPECAAGRVISLGAGTGAATIKASWPGLYTEQIFAQATVEVVANDTLVLTTWEDYVPTVTQETVLSTFEGTSVYQQARLKLVQSYTDGSSSVVTNHGQTAYDVTDDGGNPAADVVAINAYKLVAVGPGTAFVTATLLGNDSNSVEIMVEGSGVDDGDSRTHADITNLELGQPGDLVGPKDSAQRKGTVTATLNDGTRVTVLNNGAVAIPGLVQFSATNAQFTNPADGSYITIDATTGTSTLRGNGLARIVTAMPAGVDQEPLYAPGPVPEITQPNPLSIPAGHAPTKWLKCNLTAQAGDGDLGNATGLPVPLVVDPGQFVNVDIWLNSGGASLGAFSLEAHYDTGSFEVPQPSADYLEIHIPTDASAINDPVPGTVKVTAVPTAASNLTGVTKVATMTLRATNNKQGVPVYSQLSGTILEMFESCPNATCPAIAGATGPAPRSMVAGLVSIDPVGNLVYKGDFNDDGAFGVADLQTIVNYVVAPASPQFAGLDLENANIFPDRADDQPLVQAFDAYYGALISVGLSHFIDVQYSIDALSGLTLDVEVRDGSAQPQPVTSGLRVSVEMGLESGATVSEYVACAGSCVDSYDADWTAVPQRALFETSHQGDGIYRLAIPDFAALPGPDTAQFVVVLQNLNPDGSNKGDPKVYLRTPLENTDSPFDPVLSLPLCSTPADCQPGETCIGGTCTDEAGDGENCTADLECEVQLHCDPVGSTCVPDKVMGEECFQDSQCATHLTCLGALCADTLCTLTGLAGQTADCAVHLVRDDQTLDPAVGVEFELHYPEALVTLDKIVICGAFPPPAGLPCVTGDGTCELFGTPDIFCNDSVGVCWFCQEHEPGATDIVLSAGHSVTTCAKPPANCKSDRFKLLIYSAESAAINDAWLEDGSILGPSNFMTFRFTLNSDTTDEAVHIYPQDFFATDAKADYLDFSVSHTPASGVDHYLVTGIAIPD